MPAVKKSDASTASSSSTVHDVSTSAAATSAASNVEKKASTRKTFKPMSAETKEKLAEHAKTASKAHIASMRANLLLGRDWNDAHARAVEADKKRASAKPNQS